MKPKPSNPPESPELPSDVAELQALVAELRAQVAYLTRMLFGRRSETLADDPNQGQLFGVAAVPAATDPEEDEDPDPPPRRAQAP